MGKIQKRNQFRPSQGFLERLRIICGPNIHRFSKLIGMKQPIIQRYVKNGVPPSFEFFSKIANAGFSVDWLLTGRVEISKKSMGMDTSRLEDDIQPISQTRINKRHSKTFSR